VFFGLRTPVTAAAHSISGDFFRLSRRGFKVKITENFHLDQYFRRFFEFAYADNMRI